MSLAKILIRIIFGKPRACGIVYKRNLLDYWVYSSVAVLVPVEPEPPAGRLGPLGEGLLQGRDSGLAVEKNQGKAIGLALVLKSYPISV